MYKWPKYIEIEQEFFPLLKFLYWRDEFSWISNDITEEDRENYLIINWIRISYYDIVKASTSWFTFKDFIRIKKDVFTILAALQDTWEFNVELYADLLEYCTMIWVDFFFIHDIMEFKEKYFKKPKTLVDNNKDNEKQ